MESLARTWRPKAIALLDSDFVRMLFGAILPCLWVLGRRWFIAPGPDDWFQPDSNPALHAILAFGVCMGVGTQFPPRRQFVNLVFAVILGLGSALAIVYAALFWRMLPVGFVELVRSPEDLGWTLKLLVTLAAAISIVTLTAAVFVRGSVRAWRSSGTAAGSRPWRALGITIASVYFASFAIVLASQFFRSRAIAHLRTDRPEAVDTAMTPLRIAAALRGPDWIVESSFEGSEDEILRRNLDQAFFRLTGTSASERASQIPD